VAKEYPSRILPKKAMLDITGFLRIIFRASGAKGEQRAYSVPCPEPGSVTLDPVAEQKKLSEQTASRCYIGKTIEFHRPGGNFVARRMQSIRENKK